MWRWEKREQKKLYEVVIFWLEIVAPFLYMISNGKKVAFIVKFRCYVIDKERSPSAELQWLGRAPRLASSQLATIRLSEPFSFRFCFVPSLLSRPQMFRKRWLIYGLVPVRLSYYVSYITTTTLPRKINSYSRFVKAYIIHNMHCLSLLLHATH